MSENNVQSSIVATVSRIISKYHSYSELHTLFCECNVPDEILSAVEKKGLNKTEECKKWLTLCNKNNDVNALKILGNLLNKVFKGNLSDDEKKEITKKLNENGLYYNNGIVFYSGSHESVKELSQLLDKGDYESVKEEIRRAYNNCNVDPKNALAAACSSLEALFKNIIHDNNIKMPSKQTIGELWKPVKKFLGLSHRDNKDENVIIDDINKILGSMSVIVDGIGALCTHASSAHGRGRQHPSYKMKPRHARLAINAVQTLAIFVIETCMEKKEDTGIGR